MQNYVFKEEFLEPEMRESPQNEKNKNEGKAEALVRILSINALLFFFVLISILLVKFTAPKTFESIKSGFLEATQKADITKNDIENFFKNFSEFILKENDKNNVNSGSFSSDIPQKETDLNMSMGGEDTDNTLLVNQNHYVLTSKLTPPVKEGAITSKFGPRIHPITKKEGFHTGLDIANKLNTPIFAAFSGTVLETGQNEAYGNYIILKHSDNLKTFYGHLNSVKVKKGMNLRKGEVIGYMGSTGYSTGPHLHFEIRINDLRVNPEISLKGTDFVEL